jgi:hypothetical protein
MWNPVQTSVTEHTKQLDLSLHKLANIDAEILFQFTHPNTITWTLQSQIDAFYPPFNGRHFAYLKQEKVAVSSI